MRLKTTFPLMLIWTVALLGAALAAAAPVWHGHEGHEDRILTVYNPATPMSDVSVLRPDPMWRIGGDDDPAETLFGLVTDAQPTPGGTTWLLDSVLGTVYEIGPDGEILRTVGREGDGPGEFRNSTSLAVLPDAGIGVIEMMPSRIVVFGPDGLPRDNVAIGGGGHALVQRVAVHGDRIVIGYLSTRFDAGSAEIDRVLGVHDLAGTELAKILHASETQSGDSFSLDSGVDGNFVGNWVVGADGSINVHRHNFEYLVESFAQDGKPIRRIRRDYETIRLPAEAIEARRERRERMHERFRTTVETGSEERAPDIAEIIPRPDGSLWVLSSRGEQESGAGCIGVFDELDPRGRFVRQVRIEADYDADDDRFLIRGDRLYVLKEADNAPDRTFSGGGGMMMVQMSSGGEEAEDLDGDPAPYEVICYRLR